MMEKSIQKSQELADTITAMKPYLLQLDIDYAKEAVKDMIKRAQFLDSGAVLNPLYSPILSEPKFVF